MRVTAPVSFGAAQLAPVLAEFARQFPRIELEVNFSDRVVSLVDEGFDVAIRIGNPGDASTSSLVACAKRASSSVRQRPICGSLRRRMFRPIWHRTTAFIDANFREPSAWAFRAPDGGGIAVEVDGRLRFSNAEVAVTAAETGLGIARAPSFIAGLRFGDKRLVPLLREFKATPLAIYALYPPPGRHLAIKVRVFVDFLVAHYRNGPEWDKGW